MRLAIKVTALCVVWAMILVEIGENGVELVVDDLGGISNDSSKLFIRQWLMTMRCQNSFLSSVQ